MLRFRCIFSRLRVIEIEALTSMTVRDVFMRAIRPGADSAPARYWRQCGERRRMIRRADELEM